MKRCPHLIPDCRLRASLSASDELIMNYWPDKFFDYLGDFNVVIESNHNPI